MKVRRDAERRRKPGFFSESAEQLFDIVEEKKGYADGGSDGQFAAMKLQSCFVFLGFWI